MTETLAEKIDRMLATVEEQVDDSEAVFRLRTARQLLVTYDEYLQEQGDALEEGELDQEARDRLRQLGYLE